MPLKAALLVGHLVIGLVLALLVVMGDALGLRRRIPRERLAQWWYRDLLRILRVRVQVRGAPLAGPHLTVANHVSWLDIPVIGAREPTRFVSRHDVKDWPIAGQLADAAGTFYIRRGKGGARPTIDQLAPHLAQGSVALFPEGTTSDGRSVLTFHARLLEAAVQARCPVQAIALRYARGAGGEPVAPFIGDMTLAGHVLALLREPELHVELVYGEALIVAEGSTRDQLAARAQQWVAAVLGAGEWLPGTIAAHPETITTRSWRVAS